MRSNIVLWWVLAIFFALVTITYVAWNIITSPDIPWYLGIEWAGSIALLCLVILSVFLGFYLGRTRAAQGGELPEDTLTADIDDGDPELGHFSPWSWWPIVLAFAAAIAVMGLAVGTFLFPIGIGIFVIAIVGWVYEYYRGYFAH